MLTRPAMYQQALASEDGLVPQPRRNDTRALKILAKSIYRELRRSGYERKAVVALATELLGLLSEEIRSGDVRSKS